MKQKARHLRLNQTDTENIIWQKIRNRQLADCKFRRQHSVGDYIVDFVCLEKKLVIELDGSQHMESAVYDEKRSAFLEEQGITILRFWNNQVFEELESVLEVIYKELTK